MELLQSWQKSRLIDASESVASASFAQGRKMKGVGVQKNRLAWIVCSSITGHIQRDRIKVSWKQGSYEQIFTSPNT
jgi:hypothetical protein